MARIYPPIDFDAPLSPQLTLGDRRKLAVLKALDAGLGDQWLVFHHIEWRELENSGERKGEADAIVYHPAHGILVIEIKGGEIKSEDGAWSQRDDMDGVFHRLKMPPFAQARRNRFFLQNSLNRTRLGPDVASSTAITHTCWFPSITWTGPLPPDAPNSAFILDERHLDDPEKHLRKIMTSANPHAQPWQDRDTTLLVQCLAPDVHLAPSLGTRMADLKDRLFSMTRQQIEAYRGLRKQKQLLVQGCAGSGKTVLATMLCREHLHDGKKVLFTCYNKRLAACAAREFEGYQGIDVLNFHELVKKCRTDAGMDYPVPDEREKQKGFFENAHELLVEACPEGGKYDTIIVDEAYDFHPDWWAALEMLGKRDFSYYAFYDDHQNIFVDGTWVPPFSGEPFLLERNVRNTKPIGEFSRKIGRISGTAEYAVETGEEPKLLSYAKTPEIPSLLEKVLDEVVKKGKVKPDDVVVLAPYKVTSDRLGITSLMEKKRDFFTTDLVTPGQSKVRIGTIQSFKGLEADVVILIGIDGNEHACSPANLYVGATRARTMLYVILQQDFKLF